jgi:MerR family transcriptional regulator/heat shock protein HspR
MRPKQPRARKSAQDSSLPKYSIAVAADLSGVSQQQLRRLEEGGLVQPGRTAGNTRRYSDDDLEQIADVSVLSDEGINAAGIRHIQTLHAEIVALRAENAELRAQLAGHSDSADDTVAASTLSTSGPHDTPDKPKPHTARSAR